MIGLIILGLAFLFFVVIAYFCSQNWHVGHVVSMVFLCLFTLLTLFMTATLFRTNKEFHPKYLAADASLEREVAKTHILMYGDSSDPDGNDSVLGERTMAQEEQTARGRVWRNVFRIPGPHPNGVALNMRVWNNDGCQRVGKAEEEELANDEPIEPTPDEGVDEAVDEGVDEAVDEGVDEAVDAVDAVDEGVDENLDESVAESLDEAAAPVVAPVATGDAITHGIVVGQYVYAFKEFPVAKLRPEQKAYYFSMLSGEGEESWANQDTKGYCRVPVAYLGKFLVAEANPNAIIVQLQGRPDPGQIAQLENNASWVLYERLPTDIAQLFGVDADKTKISNVLPMEWLTMGGLQLPPPAYDQMIDEYAKDGKTTARTPDPMRSRVEVKFLQEYTQEVDLQVADGNLPPADAPFNVQGLAQVKSMLQGEPTKFEKDDQAFFDAATAARLQSEGIAEPVGEPLYQRKLRSFEFDLENYQKQFATMSGDIQTVRSRLADLAQSLDNLQTQIDKHREELAQLQQDQQGFQAERDALAQYRNLLRRRYEALQAEVDALASR